ncbi:hypothetical protein Tco_0648273 [Tanacetum coccineum]
MWTELYLAYEGPSNTRDTKIAALRLKFNAFKELEGEKLNGTYTRQKCLLNDLECNGVFIFQVEASSSKALVSNNFQDSDSDVEEDSRTGSEFIAELNAKYYERALLANQKRKYKRSGRVRAAEDEPSMGKGDARSGQWVEITIKKALGGRGRIKENNISKEVVFTKADESSSELTQTITSDSEAEVDNHVSLPPFPKLTRAEPFGTSNSLISLSDLTVNMSELTHNSALSKESKKVI